MSIRCLDWAFNQKCNSSSTKLVLIKLADNANDDGICWPSISYMERHCELSRSAIKENIKKLVGLGLIVIQERFKDGVQLSHKYHLQTHRVGTEVTELGGPPSDRGVGRQVTGGRPPSDHRTVIESSILTKEEESDIAYQQRRTREKLNIPQSPIADNSLNIPDKKKPIPPPPLPPEAVALQQLNDLLRARCIPPPPPPPEAVGLAKLLSDLIGRNIPNRTPPTPRQLAKWATEADKIARLDKHSWQEIERTIRWSQTDEFWKQNILSMGKLREKWNQLQAKMGDWDAARPVFDPTDSSRLQV